MKLKILWSKSRRIAVLENSMNLEKSIGLSVFFIKWSKAPGNFSAYHSELQRTRPTQMLIYFLGQHSGCVNRTGQCFSCSPGFCQDHPTSLEDAKPFYNCFYPRLPQQSFLLDKTFCKFQGEIVQPVFQILTLLWLVLQTTVHIAPWWLVSSDLACLAWFLVGFLSSAMTSMSGCYLPSISFRLK